MDTSISKKERQARGRAAMARLSAEKDRQAVADAARDRLSAEKDRQARADAALDQLVAEKVRQALADHEGWIERAVMFTLGVGLLVFRAARFVIAAIWRIIRIDFWIAVAGGTVLLLLWWLSRKP